MTADQTLFSGISVFDGTGAPPFAGEVLVQGRNIVAVSRRAGEFRSEGARMVYGAGCTLMPGLCDAHAHLGFGATVERPGKLAKRTVEEAALVMAHCGRVMLDHGFTSAYSAGSHDVAAELAASKAFAAGLVPGPRLRTCSFERSADDLASNRPRYTGTQGRQPDPGAVTDFVHSMADKGVESVKFVLNGVSAFVPGSNLVDQFYEEEIAAAGAAAREYNVKLSAHAYTPEMIKMAVLNGFHVIYHCTWADEATLDVLEAHRDSIFVGPAPGITEADLIRGPAFGVMASASDQAEQAEAVDRMKWLGTQLRKRSIRSLPGGDYGLPWNPIGTNARDIQLFVEWFGYSPAQALSAATALGGELMQMGDCLGRIKEGYLADLILIDGDPLTDVSILLESERVVGVMREGRFHKSPPHTLTSSLNNLSDQRRSGT